MSDKKKKTKKAIEQIEISEALTPELEVEAEIKTETSEEVSVKTLDSAVQNVKDPVVRQHPKSTGIATLDMINAALANNLDMDKLERLMEMHKQYEDREAKKEFAAAFAKARSEFSQIVARHDANFGVGKASFMHEKISDLQKAVDPSLGKYGFSYRWGLNQDEGTQGVTFILCHSSGHEEGTPLEGPPDSTGGKNAYHAIGSANTYLQRLTMRAGLGLAVSYDDDANTPTVSDEKITPEQEEEIKKLVIESGLDPERFCKQYHINVYSELPLHCYDDAIKRLKVHMRDNKKPKSQGD
jgi:hypothetical protein